MTWIPLYLDKKDLKEIINLLNADPDVAFIVSNGSNLKSKWIAVKEVANLTIPRYCIWHIPSGGLPLLDKNGNETLIQDPFKGWEELRSGYDKTTPYFGAGHPGIIWLNNKTLDGTKIGLSSFEWIGNHYRPLGNEASESTEKWWKKLRKEITSRSSKIPRSDGLKPEIFAFPNAITQIKSGSPRDMNP